MVRLKRTRCFSHPLCIEFINTKWLVTTCRIHFPKLVVNKCAHYNLTATGESLGQPWRLETLFSISPFCFFLWQWSPSCLLTFQSLLNIASLSNVSWSVYQPMFCITTTNTAYMLCNVQELLPTAKSGNRTTLTAHEKVRQ